MEIKSQIDVFIDEKIFKFYKDNIKNDNDDMRKKINDIVNYAVNKEGLNITKINITIKAASKYLIKKLNKEYRGIDKVTDVLSFPIFSKEELISFKEKSAKLNEIELGDIVLCLDVIHEQSEEYSTGLKRELLYMITHGVCHLLGYDHIDDNEKIRMREFEEEILNSIGVYKVV